MKDSPVAPRQCTGVAVAAEHWWAPGLALAERLGGSPRAAGRQIAPVATDGGTTTGSKLAGDATSGGGSWSTARQRLRKWADAHALSATGMFAARLADVDLTDDDLLALLAEMPDSLAARSDEPGWADFTTLVIAAADGCSARAGTSPTGATTSTASSAPERDTASWLAHFVDILAPYLDVSTDLLTRSCTAFVTDAHLDFSAVRAEFRQALSQHLARPAARALVFQLNVMRSEGRLAGTSADERFTDFVRQLRQPAALREFLSQYPVLARVLAQTCQHEVDAYRELLQRFAADRTAIIGTFFAGTDPGPLTALHAGAGDGHQGGRRVALLRFANGARVVYKPRPLAVHRHFNDLLRWLNGHEPGLDLRILSVLDRAGYGWLEFAAAAPCADRAAVERFYLRQGAILALLYALDGSDIHYENLIACGDQPVLVDMETLFHPSIPAPSGVGTDPAADALAASVYRSALLPQLLLGDHDALDVSGLGGDKGRTLPVPVVDWHAPATDEMRLVRRTVVFTGAANRPRLNGVDADPVDFVELLLSGFRTGYRSIVRHRDELLGPDGLLRRFADDDTRVVIRATRVYARLLDESTHPEVLRDALERDRVFDVLWAASFGDPLRARLVRHEIHELWDGDVPIFMGQPAHRHLWTGRGVCLADVLEEPPLNRVSAKINRMDDVDRYDQEWIIRATLATRHPHGGHDTGTPQFRPYPASAPDPDRLLVAARGVADQIIARGYDDGCRINWLGLELLDELHWSVMPLGAGLANGYTGIALFFAQLAALTGDTRYAAAARRSLRGIPQLIDQFAAHRQLAETVGCGGFAGFGGLAYALAQMSVLLADPQLEQWVAPVVQLAEETVDADVEYGVFDGTAGCLAAMLAVHECIGLKAAWQAAVHCAEKLLSGSPGQPTTPGFAFGRAGVGWALLRFAATSNDARYAEHGLEHLSRCADLAGLDSHSWCRGWPGVGLALLDTADPTADRWATTVIDRAVDTVLPTGPLPNHSLCHGELGRLELLRAAAQRQRTAQAAHLRHAGMMFSMIEQSGPRCGTPAGAASPGLLNGMAGIGHGLLRLGFPDMIPSVLLLQPPNHPPRTP